MAKCTVCDSCIKFAKGRLELFHHSQSAKHQKNSSTKTDNVFKQPSVSEMFKLNNNNNQDDINTKVRDLEIAIVQTFSRHGIAPENTECIIEVLKKYIPDSEKVILLFT